MTSRASGIARKVASHESLQVFFGEVGHGANRPLSVKGASATLDSASGGCRVDVSRDDPTTATEIAKRAHALLGK